jgi:hypothetical protein
MNIVMCVIIPGHGNNVPFASGHSAKAMFEIAIHIHDRKSRRAIKLVYLVLEA